MAAFDARGGLVFGRGVRSVDPTRRASIVSLGAWLVGCGGGGSSGGASGPAGSVQTNSLTAQASGVRYPLYIYVPPDDGTPRSALPIVYLLDGESRFQTTIGIVEASRSRVILVGIGNEANRARDYVPANACTPNGGGEALFLDFIRRELIPFIETSVGGDPARRALLGHSHGGSFVLYALFNEPIASRRFSAYLASDASIGCMEATVYGWDAVYATASTGLPVRLHLSYSANIANLPFAEHLVQRRYGGLVLASAAYGGGHIGMIPAAFADAVAFAFAA
jgi:hypothetical protein